MRPLHFVQEKNSTTVAGIKVQAKVVFILSYSLVPRRRIGRVQAHTVAALIQTKRELRLVGNDLCGWQ